MSLTDLSLGTLYRSSTSFRKGEIYCRTSEFAPPQLIWCATSPSTLFAHMHFCPHPIHILSTSYTQQIGISHVVPFPLYRIVALYRGGYFTNLFLDSIYVFSSSFLWTPSWTRHHRRLSLLFTTTATRGPASRSTASQEYPGKSSQMGWTLNPNHGTIKSAGAAL